MIIESHHKEYVLNQKNEHTSNLVQNEIIHFLQWCDEKIDEADGVK